MSVRARACVCVCVRGGGGWVQLCCRTAGYLMRAGLFSCVSCVCFLVNIRDVIYLVTAVREVMRSNPGV